MLFFRLCFWMLGGTGSFERLVALSPEVVCVAPQENQQLAPVALGVDLRCHGVLRTGDDNEPLLAPAGSEVALAVVQRHKGIRVAVEKQDGQIKRRHAGRGIDGIKIQPVAAQDAHADARERLLQPAGCPRAVMHGVRDLELKAGVAAVGHDAGKLAAQLRKLCSTDAAPMDTP